MKKLIKGQNNLTKKSLYHKYSKLLLAVDCIIFGFDGSKLKALLIKRDFEPGINSWSLMGGFVEQDEGVDDAAKRVLFQLTGFTNIFMEQLACFGNVNRDPGDRVVSMAYYSLINIYNNSKPLMDEHNAQWFDLDKLPSLLFDHDSMIDAAKLRLKEKIANHPIGFELLPERFTLQQLQSLYEAIYEKAIDKRNFAKKVLGLGLLKKLEEKDRTTSKKGAFYYTFDAEKYHELETEGLKLI